jgi:hypothetical protein
MLNKTLQTFTPGDPCVLTCFSLWQRKIEGCYKGHSHDVQSNSVTMLWKGLNNLCRYKRVSL